MSKSSPEAVPYQSELITNLGPYLKQAKSQGEEGAFFERVFNVWFIYYPRSISQSLTSDGAGLSEGLHYELLERFL